MSARRRLGLALVPVLGAGAVLAGLWLRERAAPVPPPAPPPAAVRDWEATGVAVIGHAEDGTVRHRLRAPEAVGYADGAARVAEPRLELVASDGRRWRARARSGELRGERVILDGAVLVERPDPVRPLRLETERLTAEPRRGYVETDRPVQVAEPHWETRAVGLRGWIDEGRLELLSRVRTRHEPDGAG